MEITKEVCKKLRDELKTVLPAVEKNVGVKIEVGNIRYSQTEGTIRITFSAVADGIDVENKDAIAEHEFMRYAPIYGGDPSWYGKTIFINGEEFFITGINRNAKKYNFIVSNARKRYKVSANYIAERLKEA